MIIHDHNGPWKGEAGICILRDQRSFILFISAIENKPQLEIDDDEDERNMNGDQRILPSIVDVKGIGDARSRPWHEASLENPSSLEEEGREKGEGGETGIGLFPFG
jgi:hypothetical protein